MEGIESGDVSGMDHSSSADLLAELNRKKAIICIGPFVAALSVAILCVALRQFYPVPSVLLGMGLAVLTYVAFRRDARRKTTVLWYEFEPAVEQTYRKLHLIAMDVAASASCWHVSASGEVYDKKYEAGASSVVRRQRTTVGVASPDFLKTNVETVRIEVGRQKLYLFPDRILVFDEGRFGAIGYNELELDARQRRFIEDGDVPPDAQVVDQTWAYVNKDGGPDLRFSHNPKLPVCLYDEFHFASPSGLNERLQSSRTGNAVAFAEALRDLARLTKEVADEVEDCPISEQKQASRGVVLVTMAALVVCVLAVLAPRPRQTSFEGKKSTVSAPPVETPLEKEDPATTPPQALAKTAPSPTPSLQTPIPEVKFASVDEAQREAVRRYPELGIAGSKFNSAFIARHKLYRATNAAYFESVSWPVRLAEEVHRGVQTNK